MKKLFFALLLLIISAVSHAQCAMCRASLESSDGTIKPESVNDGIVYLMVLPYLVVGLVGFAIYRLRQKKKAEV